MYFTGSKEHNVRLRSISGKKKWKLSEYGLFDEGEKRIAGKKEEEIYSQLGLPWVPPELREDRGEIEAAEKRKLPDLIELKDIKGDLHVHSSWSDGKLKIREMAEAAKRHGYKYVSISDHSKSSVVANGLDVDRLREQRKEIERAGKEVKGIDILHGSEVDILSDGSLDFPDEVLAELDFVVASIHSGLRQPGKKIMSRLLAACENPFVHAIGHPTGRLLGEREASDVDMEALVKAAADTGTFLELNASWPRLDIDDRACRMSADAGVTVVINTDSHREEHLDWMAFGIGQARRGWLEKKNVLNTRPAGELRKLLGAKRKTRKS
jgi:DNA polymerase (family 10)